jgi:hypothetical protein
MKQNDRKKSSSSIPDKAELPLNNPYSISSDIQTTSAVFNVFEDEDDDEDLEVNGNIGSKMLSKIVQKKKTSLLSKNVTAVEHKKPVKSIQNERIISLIPITLQNADKYKKVFILLFYIKTFTIFLSILRFYGRSFPSFVLSHVQYSPVTFIPLQRKH